MRIRLLSVFTVSFLFCLLSFSLYPFSQNTPTTVDIRILKIFHPKSLIITAKSDTYRIYIKDNHLFVNDGEKTIFFSKTASTIEVKEKVKRTYRGTLKIYPFMQEIVIINRVAIDDYLASVVGAEIGDAPIEAQKAQAIVSRTFLLKNLERHRNYDFCDLTHCQVYKGKESETKASRRAVRETVGIVLYKGNEISDVYYHSTCGGKTSAFSSIFDGTNQSIVSVSDSNYCINSPHYRWEWNLPVKDAPFKKIKILKRAQDERVVELVVDGKKERGWKFRMGIARQFGWNTLRSSSFTVERKGDCFHFKGKGLGHGLGMCQWGAKGMAEQGKTAEEILKHYFPELQFKHWRNENYKESIKSHRRDYF